jgi:hypothetical protein
MSEEEETRLYERGAELQARVKELERAIEAHREIRYGDPPIEPMYAADELLYELLNE